MPDEVTTEELKKSLGRRVEVIAFGISYVGRLERIDSKAGTVVIRDRKDYAVLEIERIESLRKMD